MKKLIAFLFCCMIAVASCTKEENLIPTTTVAPAVESITYDEFGMHVRIGNIIYHYGTKDQAARMAAACSAPINLNSQLTTDWLNIWWLPQGGAHIALLIDGWPTNPQWFAGNSWYGISFAKSEIPSSLCGTAPNYHVIEYCTEWLIGADSSLIQKFSATAQLPTLACTSPALAVDNTVGHHGHKR